ncbi:uncharacterized protein KY384_004929 [Bacidia gigantensis]|uniref:uncharacterized protein n=1 Tax=Bacidia gigantensis TaxID=2732470 RepID=UPI001D03939D|nr:uncharacterized protein KY384_004929 [Bacidia gigantensis]KAG8530427.1 hypothetical protein KY384_004929 [Bacidia gigantensis]
MTILRRTWAAFTPRCAVDISRTEIAQSARAHNSAPFGTLASPEVRVARDYCADLLRKYDVPAHTLLAFVPPPSQSAYLAIRAFNVELARIPDTVSTPTVGAMRYQFWRDNVNKAFAGTPPKQPVSILLAYVLDDLQARTDGTAKMSKNWFLRVISTREQYSDGRPYPSMEALEKYAENTYSTLLYLTLQSFPMASVTADHVASHIGKASGIVAILRGLPLLAFPLPPNHHNASSPLGGSLERGKQGAVVLPLDVMARTGVREEDVLRQGAQAHGLKDAIFEVATRASDHLITAREMIKEIRKGQDISHAFEHEDDADHHYASPNESSSKGSRQQEELGRAFGVFMPAISNQMWLNKLQKLDFDVFAPALRIRSWALPFKAYLANRRKSF